MKKKTLAFEEKLLKNKVAGYSVLAGAALLLTPSAAEGEIIYHDPEDIVVDSSNATVDIDIDQDGSADFKIYYNLYYSYYSSSVSFDINALDQNYVSGQSSSVKKLSNNVLISADNSWEKKPVFFNVDSAGSTWGNWPPNSKEQYFGIKFLISGNTHYGWVKASVERSVGGDLLLTVHDWAYENTPDTPIKTGDGTDLPLPIELSSFGAIEQAGNILINWQTASETENIGFVLQRKTGNGLWEDLADYRNDPSLEGKGTSSKAHNYSWVDESVLPANTYSYRLGDIDHANNITWHKEVEITLSKASDKMPGEFGLQAAFPNPFNPTLTIRYGLTEDAQTKVNILDLQGKTITSLENKFQKAGSHELQWQAGDAASGIYLVEVIAGGKRDLKKVLLTK
ncbi:MAG: T9SS type A sorting domain-containing protein [Candidatus Neomarinimicrobiota bacterium]